MTDTNLSEFSALDPSRLTSATRGMDHHLLQFQSEGQGYHSQSQQGMESLIQSALLTMPSYPQQTLTHSPHGIVISGHERASTEALIPTSTHQHHSLYNTHMPSEIPLQLFPPQHLRQLPTSSMQQASPNTPQTPHHGYLNHSILPSSSQSQTQALSTTPRQPPVPLLPMPSSSPSSLELTLQQTHSQSNSPEQSPPGTRSDRLGRLGSHGGASRRIILSSKNSASGAGSISNGVTMTGAAGQNHATKDSSGKFPCVHCHKTYLHLKHLKRHLLRHTGDRPYQCVLCKDTFSRSDILKRHFQKCSIRRGNPGNLTHLAHAHDHQRKKQKGVREQTGTLESPTETSEPYSQDEALVGDGSVFVASMSGNLKRSIRACSQCVGSKLLCDGASPCGRCHQIEADCIYLSDELRRQSPGRGESSLFHLALYKLLTIPQAWIHASFTTSQHPHTITPIYKCIHKVCKHISKRLWQSVHHLPTHPSQIVLTQAWKIHRHSAL